MKNYNFIYKSRAMMHSLHNVLLIVAFSLVAPVITFAQEPASASFSNNIGVDTLHVTKYNTPKKWAFITNVPDDLLQMALAPFQKKYLPGLAIVSVSTAILISQDQRLSNAAQQLGRNIHWQPDTEYKILVKAGNTKIIKIPLNINTALYQFGEGGTSMLLAGGFLVFGKISKDNRALQTASDITETFLTTGITDQILKRCFGRQSPFMSTRSGGRWQPFPSFKEYQQNTSNYDAFPSGHLSTLMATVTVISENYPEKKWIRPVGYVITGLVGFAMMNTEVHWAGDYPLGLALGYISGKITAGRHKNKKPKYFPLN
jgi:hypothetical protein